MLKTQFKKEKIIKIFTLKTSSCCESNKCEFILDQEANYNFFNLRIGNFQVSKYVKLPKLLIRATNSLGKESKNQTFAIH